MSAKRRESLCLSTNSGGLDEYFAEISSLELSKDMERLQEPVFTRLSPFILEPKIVNPMGVARLAVIRFRTAAEKQSQRVGNKSALRVSCLTNA